MQLYRFLTGPDDASFCHKVTESLNKGWQLYGNPCYTLDSQTGRMQCGQAVIKTITGQTYTPDIKLGDF